MNIVVISDENYATQSAVMLLSFFESNKNLHNEIYYISTGISNQNIEKIETLCNEYNSQLHYILFDENLLSQFDGIGYWSKYTFMKLFIPQVLPSIVDKVLYLDVDMLIIDNLKSVYNMDLGDNAIAAVEDVPNSQSCCKRCGLSQKSLYINSGFMLLNLSAWRKEWERNSFYKYVDDYKSKMKINDQDVINSIFTGRIKPLDWRYNVTSFFFGLSSSIWKLYPKEYKRVRRHPAVIHFTNSNKPWKETCVHQYAKRWRNTLYRTHFTSESFKNSFSLTIKLFIYNIVDFWRIRLF